MPRSGSGSYSGFLFFLSSFGRKQYSSMGSTGGLRWILLVDGLPRALCRNGLRLFLSTSSWQESTWPFQKGGMAWTICCLLVPFSSPNLVNFLALREASRASLSQSRPLFLVFSVDTAGNVESQHA
uniref:Uncharacterized protein n=1 Tax=Setaria viridis TaxID=4556 RepID=A0A4U6W2R8_SETVI|nr:hypothetical protein SEVIR_2G333350v2 [Setaria viridis]